MAQKGKLSVAMNNDVIVASFLEVSILDEANIKRLGEELEEAVRDREDTKLVINFSNIDYLSSAVLGRLVKVLKIVRKQKGKIKLCCVKSSIAQVFKVTKLDKMFEIFPDEDKAVKSFLKKKSLFGR